MNQLNNSRLSASICFSRYDMEQRRYPVERIVRGDLARAVAEKIVGKSVEKHEDLHSGSVEFRMNVYVLSPSELHSLIDQAAERRALRMPPCMDVSVQELP